jgi:hypothetical protein
VTQTITIDGEKYEVDRTVAGAIDEMQNEIEATRDVIVGLTMYVDGEPCWCQWQTLCGLIDRRQSVAKGTSGKHLKVCRDANNLPLWRSPSGVNLPWKDSDRKAKQS